jgi:ATP-dependent RNA helicase HelY
VDVTSARARFLAGYDFTIDRFQLEAFDALDAGRHVVVAAPTGSGKTVVAEYGIATAIAAGRRAFYTAPIKALSNQKYRDLVEVHGADRVGLLTGDNTINGDAPIVVMTTEVLRNMIYGRVRRLDTLGLVVLDEVHFLQDTYRGPVWEEVIIHLPAHVRLVCLSATVSNVVELAEWISTVRGPTSSVVEDRRPVQLENYHLVTDRARDELRLMPMFVGGRVNKDAQKLDDAGARPGPRRRGDRRPGDAPRHRPLATPGRVEVVELMRARSMLPAIYFIFSRAQCEVAAQACLDAGVQLTTPDERSQIRRIIDARLGGLAPADLDVLGYDRFVGQLEAGLARHHAGMVPPMKEVVEACFAEGLIKVVFATETLAVGINMPARTVVIEKMTKFTGDHHERLNAGEYTQLTGRAGRRGIDERGNAIVLWTPWVRFGEVAELAASSSFDLRSVFRPTYNMSANLIRTYTSDEAHHLLNLSFAQYQADRDIVRLEARLERRRAALAAARADSSSPYGDLEEYRRLVAAEKDRRRRERGEHLDAIDDAVERLRPGAVIRIDKGKHHGPAVVIAHAHRKGEVRLTVLTRAAHAVHLTADDFARPPSVLAHLSLPPVFVPNRRADREDLAARLRAARLERSERSERPPDPEGPSDRAIASTLPVAGDPDLRVRLAAAGQADRIAREVADLEVRVGARTHSLARDFDRVLGVLERYGYVDIDGWTLTDAGQLLSRLFHESDLLVVEVLRAGLLDGLGPADVAALVSVLVYEHRSPEPAAAPWFSSTDVRRRWERIRDVSAALSAVEAASGLPVHRPPDPAFAAVAYAWVAGEGFAEVVADEDLTGGDFVRGVKQLIDLLRQLAILAPEPGTRSAAASAAESALRGVVADSAIVVAVTAAGPGPAA